MKNIIYIITILLLFVCTSCEDWLAVSPKAEIEASELFETEQGFEDALTGIYIGMADQKSYGQYLSWQILEDLAHQYDVESGSYEELQNYDYENITSVSVIEDIWLQQYNTIAEVNLLLKSVESDGAVLETERRSTIKGEALALRAYCHFDLLRLFGHGNLENRTDLNSTLTIPYVTEISKDITAQKSYDETFQLLEKDIDEALSLLDSVAEIDQSHINYDAVVALQARVFLWQGKKAEALQAVQPLLLKTYSWSSHSTFTESNTFSAEHLWHLNVTKLPDYMEYSFESHINGTTNKNWLMQSDDFLFDIFGIVNGGGEGLTDVRYLEQHEMEDSDEWLTIKLKPTEDSPNKDYLVPMLKIAEVYLIAIECLASDIEGKDLAKAVEYLNFLKEQRNIMPQYFIDESASAEDIQDAVFKEYRKEFIMEGQLFYFYKRKGVLVFPRMTGASTSDMSDEKYVLPYPDIEFEFGRVQSI